MKERALTLFLCGDVMLGRGIDQILPHSVDPRLHESHVPSAIRYVELAEGESGPIPSSVEPSYPWGDALERLDEVEPAARIVNLETAVTTHDRPWPGKAVHYRTHPGNVSVLAEAGIEVCVLANNHVLDWGVEGLVETLECLEEAGIETAGAGRNLEEARRPAILEGEGGRILVFAFGSTSSGIPREWAATPDSPGVDLLRDLSPRALERVALQVRGIKEEGDVAVASIHWGSNWGHRIPSRQRDFARGLVDEAGADVVHGHSSHHPRPMEVHRDRLILYGCGDFINDYEGIGGRERLRGDLVLMYLPLLETSTGTLLGLRMVPLQIRRLRLERPSEADIGWLAETLTREGREMGTRVEVDPDGALTLRWG